MAPISFRKTNSFVINNILHNKSIPIYGDGTNIRDWLYVIDHAKAADQVFHHGKITKLIILVVSPNVKILTW